MKNKKSQITKIFTYLLSIIMIISCSYLVIGFIYNIVYETDRKQDYDFFREVERDYSYVSTTYGIEKKVEYRISSQIDKVCFALEYECLLTEVNFLEQEDIESLEDSKVNFFVFEDQKISLIKNLGLVFLREERCSCFDTNTNLLSFYMVNENNKVYIEK